MRKIPDSESGPVNGTGNRSVEMESSGAAGQLP